MNQWWKKMGVVVYIVPAFVLGVMAVKSLSGYEPVVYAMPVFEESIVDDVNTPVIAEKTDESEAETDGSEEETSIPKGNFNLEDGIYVGVGTGYSGDVKVSVEIHDKTITAINIISNVDDAAFFNRAKVLVDTIVEKQSLDVDTVSGATYSSKGIINAVKNAVTGVKDTSEAVNDNNMEEPVINTVEEPSEYSDGTYYGTGTGFAGDLQVAVTVEDGKIASVSIVKTNDGDNYIQKASSLLLTMVQKQSTNVDTVSGATFSSAGIIEATRNALAQAQGINTENQTTKITGATTQIVPETVIEIKVPVEDKDLHNDEDKGLYNDGVYTVTSLCSPDEDEDFWEYVLQMKVTIQNDRIIAVEEIVDRDNPSSSNKSYINRAANGIVSQILNGQSLDSIDTVSRATCSSKAILNAAQAALDAAKR